MKTCRTCQHHYLDALYGEDWCRAPTKVDSAIGRSGAMWCSMSRAGGPCGEHGSLWEERKPAVNTYKWSDKVWDWFLCK